ncbi:MAG TPA: DUF916 domain-containing protein [Acidimicrobiia bacterium]|nr:DUF916 domain-containing protein [Acidimicrobiia bacterium]
MRRLTAVITVALVALVATAQAASAGNTSDQIGAVPVPGSLVAKDGGGYYQISAAPGATVAQSVRVTNPNDHAIDVRIAGVDGLTSPDTGSSFANPAAQQTAAGTWVTPRDVEFTMQPGETRDEPFTVHVPLDASPGVHLAGVTVYSPVKRSSPSQGGQFGVVADVQLARTIAVEVDTPGPAVANLTVTGAKAVANHSGLLLGLDLANTGTAYAHGNGIVRVDKTQLVKEFKIDTFVPGTSITYKVPWMDEAREGTYPVHVHLAWENGKTFDWDGTVTVTGATKSALANVKPHSDATSTVKQSSSTSMLAVALVAVGTVLALALLGAVVYAVSSRRRRRPRRGARATRATAVTTDEPASRQDRRRHRRNASRGRHGRTRTGRAQATSRTARRR